MSLTTLLHRCKKHLPPMLLGVAIGVTLASVAPDHWPALLAAAGGCIIAAVGMLQRGSPCAA